MALFKKKETETSALPEVLPKHVGFIMDGNGRWAKKRGLPRPLGHAEGAKTFRKILRHCKDVGLQTVSFYAFSTVNWKRPQEEVQAIMNIFREYLDDVRELLTENTRMIFLGSKDAFDKDIQEKMLRIEEDTKDCNEMTLLLAANYGGRDDITHAARILAEKVRKGEISPDDITEKLVAENLYTAGYPDVDFLIRPSGELRLSNFLIWQCAYAEYYFTNILWPYFSPAELDKALIEDSNRHRRFGGV